MTKKTLQKSALENLIEVRRETLQKVFGENYERCPDMRKIMSLEEHSNELRKELLDRDMSVTKVQTWFKLRSKAFQSHCEKLVKEAQDQVRKSIPPIHIEFFTWLTQYWF